MKKLANYFLALLVVAISLSACGGGGGGSTATTRTITSISYSGQYQIYTYSDGTTQSNSPSSSSESYASDHVTRTTTYTYADGETNDVTDTVSSTETTPSYTDPVIPDGFTSSSDITAPSTSSRATVYGDGHSVTLEDGSSSTPFEQDTLSTLSITDPNAIVTSDTDTYDLTWTSTFDTNGQTMADIFTSATGNRIPSTRLSASSPVAVLSRTITSLDGGEALMSSPHSEVLTAWDQGFTGKGISTLTIDDGTPSVSSNQIGSCSDVIGCKAVITQLTFQMTSPGAFDGLSDALFIDSGGDIGDSFNKFLTGMSDNPNATSGGGFAVGTFSVKVVNHAHFSDFTRLGLDPTASSDQATMTTNLSNSLAYWDELLAGTESVNNTSTTLTITDAAIAKAAGNDGVDVQHELLTSQLINNSGTLDRTLIVGSLDGDGSTSSPASISSFSNLAGSNSTFSDRFVLANGNAPFLTNGVIVNSTALDGSDDGTASTAFASARVAGYLAILRQKFPNLSGEQAVNIILDTARTDTLSCSPSCSAANVGKGEASLSRALAPIGYLR